jgi:RsiW-degrading membrane proteinase PrsW (M82 family)
MAFLTSLIFLIFAVLPAVVCVTLIWRLDRYDREPVPMMCAMFLAGALGSTWLAHMGQQLLAQSSHASPWIMAHSIDFPRMMTIVWAPLTEETAKLLVLLPLLVYREFDNMTDGFVYGAAVGFGFGAVENFLFLDALNAEPQIVGAIFVIRTIYCAVLHGVCSSIVGAALGWGRYRRTRRAVPMLMGGLLIALAVHALWNALVLSTIMMEAPNLFWLDIVTFPIEAVTVFVVFRLCVFNETKILHKELQQEATGGILPAAYVPHLSSWQGRIQTDWLPASIPPKPFIRAATRLAMRRHQRTLLGERTSDSLEKDLAHMRSRIFDMLQESSGEITLEEPAPTPWEVPPTQP